ncbi:phosphate acyltransferase PlsX [Thermodesulfobacteriota bacterium]
MRIAVDAMGGDRAPEVIVQGVLEAVAEWGIEVTLVGRREAILNALEGGHKNIEVHHCEGVVQMDESPLKAVRKKKDASIRIAFDLVKKGEVDAVVSAGNSGATLAAGVLILGKLESVQRPAIASIFPGEQGEVILIDVGANVDCRPEHLFQFGIMAHAFATSCLGIGDPKIGLLSIGEEGGKGNEQVRLAHTLFKNSPLNFIGNVEGRDILSGKAQIIVCDGFVGNVALKLSEGMAEAIVRTVGSELAKSFLGRVGLFLGRRAFGGFKKKFDYAEYGGAPILGMKGIGVVCHGGSSARAIKNAVKMAATFVKNDIQTRQALQLAEFQGKGA